MISVDEQFLPIKTGFAKKYHLKEVLDLLDNPQISLPTINVVGTNGKGSVSFYLSTGLLKKYSKVGLFISPAFLYQNERIQINNIPISDADLKKYLAMVEPYIEPYQLTFFELWTLIAILYFKEQQVEIVVMEAGIGGIKDATNLMTNQIGVLLTAIGFDHVEVLGNSIESILENKIKIIKPNSTLYISSDNLQYKSLIKKIINKLNYSINVVWTKPYLDQIAYQQGNKGLVKTVMEQFEISDETFLSLDPPLGRFTVLSKTPLVIIDGAHNENGVESLIASFKKAYGDKNPVVLVGFSSHKDHQKLLELLTQAFGSKIYLTQFDHPKSWVIDDSLKANQVDDWKVFLEQNIAAKNDIIICGSLYFIPQVYQWFKQN